MIKPSKLFAIVFAFAFIALPSICYAQNSFEPETLTPQMLIHQKPPYEKFDDVTVHYSVFNSTQIQANIAELNQLKRSSNTVLVNIAIIDNDAPHGGGIAAKISGYAANLMQQRRSLEFKEIRENGVVYYLASLRFNHEEMIHFTIDVEPLLENKKTGTNKSRTIKFTKKLYKND